MSKEQRKQETIGRRNFLNALGLGSVATALGCSGKKCASPLGKNIQANLAPVETNKLEQKCIRVGEPIEICQTTYIPQEVTPTHEFQVTGSLVGLKDPIYPRETLDFYLVEAGDDLTRIQEGPRIRYRGNSYLPIRLGKRTLAGVEDLVTDTDPENPIETTRLQLNTNIPYEDFKDPMAIPRWSAETLIHEDKAGNRNEYLYLVNLEGEVYVKGIIKTRPKAFIVNTSNFSSVIYNPNDRVSIQSDDVYALIPVAVTEGAEQGCSKRNQGIASISPHYEKREEKGDECDPDVKLHIRIQE